MAIRQTTDSDNDTANTDGDDNAANGRQYFGKRLTATATRQTADSDTASERWR